MSATIIPSAIEHLIGGLVSARHWQDASYIHMPIFYAGGSQVTVTVSPVGPGRYRVSDAGFGYREIEDIGAQRSFGRIASSISDEFDIQKNARAFFVDVSENQLFSAVSDIGMASWRLVDRIYEKRREEGHDEDIVEFLTDRLKAIFGSSSVSPEETLIGASTSPWEMTAVVRTDHKIVAFQSVSKYANSIYRANAAFDDLSALDNPPRLVAVVPKKDDLGSRLSLLSRSARIIEEDQSDQTYLTAAA